MISGWVLDDNICQLLDVLSWLVKHDFTKQEWDAIAAGLEASDLQNGKWHAAEFSGQGTIKFRVAAKGGTNQIHLEIDAPEPLRSGVEASILIAQSYKLTQ